MTMLEILTFIVSVSRVAEHVEESKKKKKKTAQLGALSGQELAWQ